MPDKRAYREMESTTKTSGQMRPPLLVACPMLNNGHSRLGI